MSKRYPSPEQMFYSGSSKFDGLDPSKGPSVFVSEYAAYDVADSSGPEGNLKVWTLFDHTLIVYSQKIARSWLRNTQLDSGEIS